MAKDEKKGFLLYYDYRDHLNILTDEERGKLLMALLDYGATGEAPKLDGAALMAFSFITSQMDRDAERYAEKCKKRSEAGKQGGRPRKAKAPDDGAEEANAPTDTEEKAKKPNAFFEKQTKAKKPDTETDTDTDTKKDTDTDTTSPLPPSKGGIGKTPSTPAEPVDADKTPYNVIVTLYHDRCKSYPKLRGLSDKRKKAIAARWKEYEHSLDTFRELFEKAESSKFLKGEIGGRNWRADFNWLMNSENMAKVLEGKYDNQEQSTDSSFDIDEFYNAAIRSSMRAIGRVEPQMSKPAEPPKTAADDEGIRKRGERLKALLDS